MNLVNGLIESETGNYWVLYTQLCLLRGLQSACRDLNDLEHRRRGGGDITLDFLWFKRWREKIREA